MKNTTVESNVKSRFQHELNLRYVTRLVLLIGFYLFVSMGCGQGQVYRDGDFKPLDNKRRTAIIDAITEKIDNIYVFPDVAQEMESYLRTNLREGKYSEIERLEIFTQTLTQDLQSISHDLHLRVSPISDTQGSDSEELSSRERHRRFIDRLRAENFGFRKVEILDENIGYLDLRGFVDASLGGETAITAMNELADVAALIIDLRQNGGGSPSMIQLITSYFFEKPIHLNSFYIRRTDNTHEFWTHAQVEGPRMTDTPIFILTSHRTFSAAEEFTYNLKHLKRATIIGETTGGGAHPVERHTFPKLNVQISVPYGRAVNPITGTNWEGTGVKPHIEVPSDEALETAINEALNLLSR